MAVKRAFNDRRQFFDSSGDPLNGGQVFWYAAGSSTKQNTYTTSAGSVANSNPMVLDAAGRFQQEVWLTVGETYKMVIASSTDTDPPASPFWTEDSIQGINDASLTIDQWITGPTPTYVSSTSFTLVGDQTSDFTVGRRVKITDAGGTKYGTIKTSAYTSLTTITLDSNESDSLASPTSAVSYGIINPTNTSLPVATDTNAVVSGSSDRTKKYRLEVDGFTTATTRVGTPPNYDHRIMSQTKGADVASASTIDLDAATGDLIDVTGTTPITAITLSEGRTATARFTGALVLTHGASLVLPGAANITTVAGDFAVFRGYAAGVVRCASYTRADGTPLTGIVLGTKQATTSGTSIPFTGIPSWAKRVKLMMDGVSTNGVADLLVQIGDSGGVEITGYVSAGGLVQNAAASAVASSTAGFVMVNGNAANSFYGVMTISLIDPATNSWIAEFSNRTASTATGSGAGSKALSGALDRVVLTTTGGTNTFDAGSVNISYE